MDSRKCCSFCGKSQLECKKLIQSPRGDAYICEDCIDICKDIVKDDSFNISGEENTQIELPTPAEIKNNVTLHSSHSP